MMLAEDEEEADGGNVQSAAAMLELRVLAGRGCCDCCSNELEMGECC